MNKIFFLGFLAATLSACNGQGGLGSASQADTVVLDVRCAADSECPAGFQCETEVEHGTESSYCVSDDDQGTSNGQCPAGYELETEHAETFCKAHGGGNSGSGGSGADDSGAGGSGADDSGAGGSGADDSGAGGAAGGGAQGATCATNADCATGLECEILVENGVTTSTCQPHGGKG